MNDQSPSMLKPTLIGGSVFGVLGAIPIVNCACCLLMMGGGFLASFLYSKVCQPAGVAFRAGTGAVVGLVAGFFYSIVAGVLTGVFTMIKGGPSPEDIDRLYEMFEQFNLPPEAVDNAMRWIEGSSSLLGVIFGFFVTLLVAGGVLAPCIAWYMAGSSAAHEQAERLRKAPLQLARLETDRLAFHVAMRLESLRESEARRPYTDYRARGERLPAGCLIEEPLGGSPLAMGPSDPLVWAHFQIDSVGQLTLPHSSLKDEGESVVDDASTISSTVAEELECAATDYLASIRRSATSLGRRIVDAPEGMVIVGPFNWHTATGSSPDGTRIVNPCHFGQEPGFQFPASRAGRQQERPSHHPTVTLGILKDLDEHVVQLSPLDGQRLERLKDMFRKGGGGSLEPFDQRLRDVPVAHRRESFGGIFSETAVRQVLCDDRGVLCRAQGADEFKSALALVHLEVLPRKKRDVRVDKRSVSQACQGFLPGRKIQASGEHFFQYVPGDIGISKAHESQEAGSLVSDIRGELRAELPDGLDAFPAAQQ